MPVVCLKVADNRDSVGIQGRYLLAILPLLRAADTQVEDSARVGQVVCRDLWFEVLTASVDVEVRRLRRSRGRLG